MPIPDQIELLCLAIQKKAQGQAEKIISAAKEAAQRRLEAERRRIALEMEQKKTLLAQQAHQEARRILDAAELQSRRSIMATREEIYQMVLDQGRTVLEGLKKDAPRYIQVLETMVKRAAGLLPGSEMELRVSRHDQALVKDHIGRLEQAAGRRILLSGQPAAITGGIIASSPEGKMLVDLSFEAIFRKIEPELRDLVARRIFHGA